MSMFSERGTIAADTFSQLQSNSLVPQLVALRAAATPDAVALVSNTHVLTYQELNCRANQLAHYLRTLGVGPGTLVALCVERSLDMVVGLLGILKTGGAYVPLDSAYPAERLAFMLEDSRAPVLITRQHIATQLSIRGISLICFDADASLLARHDENDPTLTATTDDLAYVIYTSGSTGRPKGVQITHGSLLNLVSWHQGAFSVTSSDRATQVASPAFDATGWELWPYLTCGASVYVPDEDIRSAPLLLRNWLTEQRITITFLPTVLAESVIALPWRSDCTLRFLLTGADTLHRYPSPDLPFTLINNYGPTEATVVATSGRVPPLEHPDGPPSIGRPIANTQIYILDDRLQPVHAGEPGELYIGGAGLARGYLNRPELTEERFIPHPFSSQPDARLYKTGDLARFLPDGQIAFLGRNDQQIKLRGYRIEPAEIISALNEHVAVQASVVVACADTTENKRLIAYVVLVPGARISVSSLREMLSASLPEYMIPGTFVLLDALPLTPNGKLDRGMLPMPDETNILRDTSITLPTGPVEERVERIVASLLGLERVGVDDNFFLLGGHSLLGTQIIAQIAKGFAVDLVLRTLFEAPSVRLLAAAIERLILAKLETMSDDEARQLLA